MISVNKRHKYLGSATGNFFMHIGHGVKVCFNHGGDAGFPNQVRDRRVRHDSGGTALRQASATADRQGDN